MNTASEEQWLFTISSKRRIIELNFKEIARYKDLLFLFVKRDVVVKYKQTILGPLWYFIQPLFTSVIFTLIFNNIADISAGDGVPPFLFNLAGITAWNYFKECLTGTSDTFKKNQGIFGKVYFPRVIIPMSVVISNLIKFGLQLLVFFGFYLYFVMFTEKASNVSLQISLVLLPVLIIVMGTLGLGFGMIISSMTTKYRDLTFLVAFGVQLLMYASAVMYPLELIKSKVADGRIPKIAGYLIEYNPMTSIIEMFRVITLGIGDVDYSMLIYTVIVSTIIFLFGLVIFNKTEKSFIDTV
ncbi:ABC transporter permease [Flavivirga aquimarina]|uniref:Transport permease protein n=1 Tax=Flavivirga aquimarina TaxID=2027862 RepID=A0ABT8WBQ1_9FLAO|nr:ABC transporter permease [Flavivirga aquimarina]MDO5970570.1 ABC transporter permease [Flavivirga aquimarina]